MTYSRPGNGRVNVSPGRTGGNVPEIRLPDPVRRTEDAAYRDYRSPSQAAKNVAIKNQGINALIEFATGEEVQRFARQEIDRRAKQEAGKAIDAYPAIATTNKGTPEEIAAYNALSPRAKDFVVEAKAANAVSAYGPALEGQLAKETILTAPGSTEEQRAPARARATAAARDAAGLSALPPYQLVVNGERLAQIDGAFKGTAYKARVAKEADLAQVGLIQGAAASLSDAWRDLSKIGATDVAGDQPLTAGWRETQQAVVDAAANNFGPQGQARILAAGIGEAVSRITDPQEKLEFLQRTRAEARRGPLYGPEGKTDIYSIPLDQKGKTIKSLLDELIPGAEVEADKSLLGKTYLQMEQLRAAGDVQGARNLGLSSLELLNDTSKIPSFIADIESLTTRKTPEMQQRGFSMFERQLDGEDSTALYKEMILAPVGTYDPNDIMKMFTLAQKGEENVDYIRKRKSFRNAQADAGGAYDVGFSNYLQYTGLSDQELYRNDASGKKVLTEAGLQAQFNFLQEVRAKYFAKMDEADPAKFNPLEALKSSINEAIADKKEKAGSNEGVVSDPQSSYVGWAKSSLGALAQASAANGGQLESTNIPAAAINPNILSAWQQQNPDTAFDSLSGLQKEKLLVRSIQSFKKFDAASGQYVNYTEQEATQRAVAMLKEAERKAADNPAPATQRVPDVVPETPEELKQARRPGVKGYGREPIVNTLELLNKAAQWATTKQEDPFNFNKIFNNGGLGPQAMSYVDGFLNMTLGAAPANAGQLDFGTPEGLEALRQSWHFGQQGLNTAPLPQVAAATPVRYAPVAILSDKHELFVMIGVAEGTRTASGGYTKAYYGHTDSGDGNWNRGTVSGGRGTSASPQMVDRKWMGTLTNVQQRMRGALIVHGLQPGTAGYNRVMFNLMDLTVQSPAAARDFAGKLIQMKNANWTVEAIAKARADSYINPATGRLDAPGFGNNYQRLFKDQRSRAGVYDYRRRI